MSAVLCSGEGHVHHLYKFVSNDNFTDNRYMVFDRTVNVCANIRYPTFVGVGDQTISVTRVIFIYGSLQLLTPVQESLKMLYRWCGTHRGVRISFSWEGGGVVSKLDRLTDQSIFVG